MTKKQNKLEKEGIVSGHNIYVDEKGRTIYHNPLTKTNYIILENVAKTYTRYSLRHFIAFIIAYTVAIIFNNILIGIFSGLISWALIAYMFYTKFLPELPTDNRFKPYKKITFIENLANNTTTLKLVAAIFSSLILAFILFYYAKESFENNSTMLSLNILLGIAALAFSICSLLALIKKHRTK